MKRPFKPLSSALTLRIIALYQGGYVNDFSILANAYVQCMQTGEKFLKSDLCICLVDTDYNNLTHSYRYIHTTNTQLGNRGLVMVDFIVLPVSNVKLNNDEEQTSLNKI